MESFSGYAAVPQFRLGIDRAFEIGRRNASMQPFDEIVQALLRDAHYFADFAHDASCEECSDRADSCNVFVSILLGEIAADVVASFCFEVDIDVRSFASI